jgi:Ulp1 family protease
MKKIYIPVNLGNQHWVLVVIDNPSKTITFYDSLMSEEAFNDNTGEITSKCNRNILDNIMRLLKEYDTNLPDYKYTSVRLPRQEGGEFINFCIYLSCYLNSLTV